MHFTLSLIFQTLQPILLTALTYATTKIGQLVRKKIKDADDQAAAIEIADAVVATVKELDQTLVEELKKASPDGSLSPEQKARIKAQALGALKRQLPAKVLAALLRKLNFSTSATDSYLSSRLEAAVHDRRMSIRLPMPMLKPAI